MKQQDIIRYALLALVSFGIIRFFFPPPQQEPTTDADRSFVAPIWSRADVVEPLDVEIDFVDAPVGAEAITVVDTPQMVLHFSNHGAVVKGIGFKRNDSAAPLMEAAVPEGREHGLFLLALHGIGSTPYEYKLISHVPTDEATTLTYEAKSPIGLLRKQFVVRHDTYIIDVTIQVERPSSQASPESVDTSMNEAERLKDGLRTRVRLLFDGPMMTQPIANDEVKAVSYSPNNAFQMVPIADMEQQGKEQPTFFGIENRYFVTMLIADHDNFTRRAYLNIGGKKTAQAVLQTARLYAGDLPQRWRMSFYCGPKELAALTQADKRLDSYLNYGFFWFFAKPMLWVLLFFHKLFDSYGFAIILLTLVLHLLMLPFSISAESGQRKQKEYDKKLRALSERYRHDPKELEAQQVALMRKHASGMFMAFAPLLMQLPLLIALRTVLADAIELYRVPFSWIPDLSLPDPYYVLPALTGSAMLVRMMMTAQKPQEMVRSLVIALIATGLVFVNVSAGLGLYIFMTLLCGLVQTVITRWIWQWRKG